MNNEISAEEYINGGNITIIEDNENDKKLKCKFSYQFHIGVGFIAPIGKAKEIYKFNIQPSIFIINFVFDYKWGRLLFGLGIQFSFHKTNWDLADKSSIFFFEAIIRFLYISKIGKSRVNIYSGFTTGIILTRYKFVSKWLYSSTNKEYKETHVNYYLAPTVGAHFKVTRSFQIFTGVEFEILFYKNNKLLNIKPNIIFAFAF